MQKKDSRVINSDKLETCKRTRNVAAQTLLTVLRKLLKSNKPISEVMLRDAWLSELQKEQTLFPNGWYDPPPHGIIVLFADENNVERFNYLSARPKETWPREDIFLDKKKGILYCYASPVDKKTGIIGDFAISLYFGRKPEIQDLLKTCLLLDRKIFNFAKIGMTIAAITQFAEEQISKFGMTNRAVSVTDKAIINIGHSIPGVLEEWNSEEKKILANGVTQWKPVAEMICNKRFFVNTGEQFIIRPGTAFTIEPRPKVNNKPQLPEAMNYHTIALFKKNGEKELLTDFDNLFTLAGMEYMKTAIK